MKRFQTPSKQNMLLARHNLIPANQISITGEERERGLEKPAEGMHAACPTQ